MQTKKGMYKDQINNFTYWYNYQSSMDICAVMATLQIADQIQFKERASILKPMKKILNADLCK